MALSDQQIRLIHQALLDSFPAKDELGMMLKKQMGVLLDVVAEADNQTLRVYRLITWAESTGNVRTLINAAVDTNPGNPILKELAGESGYWRLDFGTNTESGIAPNHVTMNLIYQAILDAYTRDELRRVVAMCMGVDFDHVAPDKDFSTQVFELVWWAKRQGRAIELVHCAQDSNRGNPALRRLREELLGGERVTSVPQPAADQSTAVNVISGDPIPYLRKIKNHLRRQLAGRDYFEPIMNSIYDLCNGDADAARLMLQRLIIEHYLLEVPGNRYELTTRANDLLATRRAS